MFPLHRPGHDVNSCKVMRAQAKSIKSNWLTTCGSGACCVWLQVTKKRPAEGQDLIALVANT